MKIMMLYSELGECTKWLSAVPETNKKKQQQMTKVKGYAF